jgi:hypothetical protein
MPEFKTYRVYATVLMNAYFDVVAASEEEAMDTLPTTEMIPDFVSDDVSALQTIHGAVLLEDAFGLSFEENMSEIARNKALTDRITREDAEFSKQEALESADENQDADADA